MKNQINMIKKKKFFSSIDIVFFFSITVTFIFNISVTPKITYSYWFVIIFFFMFKKVLNISYYSVFNCFIFFFQSKKICNVFIMSSVAVSSISFYSLKRFLASLIMLSSVFFIFFKL